MNVQEQLLRVLQEKTFERAGGNQTIQSFSPAPRLHSRE